MYKTALDISAKLDQLEMQSRPVDRARANDLIDELRAIPANAVEIIDRLVRVCKAISYSPITDSDSRGAHYVLSEWKVSALRTAVKFAKGEKEVECG